MNTSIVIQTSAETMSCTSFPSLSASSSGASTLHWPRASCAWCSLSPSQFVFYSSAISPSLVPLLHHPPFQKPHMFVLVFHLVCVVLNSLDSSGARIVPSWLWHTLHPESLHLLSLDTPIRAHITFHPFLTWNNCACCGQQRLDCIACRVVAWASQGCKVVASVGRAFFPDDFTNRHLFRQITQLIIHIYLS